MSEQYQISAATRAAIIEGAMTKCKENKQRALNNNQKPETANAVSSNEILKRAQSNHRDAKKAEWLRQYMQSKNYRIKKDEMLRAFYEHHHSFKYNKGVVTKTTAPTTEKQRREVY